MGGGVGVYFGRRCPIKVGVVTPHFKDNFALKTLLSNTSISHPKERLGWSGARAVHGSYDSVDFREKV